MGDLEIVSVKGSKENRVRLSLYVVPDVKKYLDEQSEAFGMSVSAFITMVIQQYRMQNKAMSTMSEMMLKLELLDNIAASLKSGSGE